MPRAQLAVTRVVISTNESAECDQGAREMGERGEKKNGKREARKGERKIARAEKC